MSSNAIPMRCPACGGEVVLGAKDAAAGDLDSRTCKACGQTTDMYEAMKAAEPAAAPFPIKEMSVPMSVVPSPFDVWVSVVRTRLTTHAAEKGYDTTGQRAGSESLDVYPYRNEVADFLAAHFPGHIGGEVFLKTLRFGAKGDPEDLIKIAAWAFIKWAQVTQRG